MSKKTLTLCKKLKLTPIFQVKANQKELLLNFEHTIKFQQPAYSHKTNTEKSRGRIETREIKTYKPNTTVSGKLGFITDEFWRQNVKVIIQVTRTTKLKDTKASTKNKSVYKPQTTETSYYFTTTAIFKIIELHQFIRNHWSIENKNHYVRDVTLGEDKSRIRKNPIIIAIIRSITLNTIRFGQRMQCSNNRKQSKDNQNPYQNIQQQININKWSSTFFEDYQWLWRSG